MLRCPKSFVFVAERILSLPWAVALPLVGTSVAMCCCALPVALALLGLSLKAGGGLELLVQTPAAAPPVSVGFCEAG